MSIFNTFLIALVTSLIGGCVGHALAVGREEIARRREFKSFVRYDLDIIRGEKINSLPTFHAESLIRLRQEYCRVCGYIWRSECVQLEEAWKQYASMENRDLAPEIAGMSSTDNSAEREFRESARTRLIGLLEKMLSIV